MSTEREERKNGLFFKMRKFELSYRMETYYKQVEEFTPKTVFIPLTELTVKYLYEVCNNRYKTKQFKMEVPEDLKDFLGVIQDSIEKNFPNGVFGKFSTRSPKDFYYTGNDFHPRFAEILLDEMKKQDGNIVGDITALKIASRKILRARNAEEVLEMIFLSERSRCDLMKFLEYPDAYDDFNLILREFEEMDPFYEFRGFVYDKKFNALSQYCYMEYSQKLVDDKERVERQIIDFFEKNEISKRIDCLDNYIIDFAIVEGRVRIIELNPFFTDTGACMFTWGKDSDIVTGKKPFEFRIVEAPLEDPMGGIPSNISRMLMKCREELGREPLKVKNSEKVEEEEDNNISEKGWCLIM